MDITINATDLPKIRALGEAMGEALRAKAEAEETTQYVFDEADFGGGRPAIRGAGSDRFTLDWTGKGPQAFLATFPDGRPASKPADSFRINTLRFVPMGAACDETDPSMPHEDDGDEILNLRDRPMDAKVTTTSTVGFDADRRPVCQIKIEMHVRRDGGGIVRELTEDPLENREILDPDLYLLIGRLTGRTGTLFLLREAEAEQQGMDLRGPFDAPEGVKERTLRRGSKKAAAALRDAVEAKRTDGTIIPLDDVRAAYDADPEMNLRTWDGGPVKVLRGFQTIYVLTMPAAEAGEE